MLDWLEKSPSATVQAQNRHITGTLYPSPMMVATSRGILYWTNLIGFSSTFHCSILLTTMNNLKLCNVEVEIQTFIKIRIPLTTRIFAPVHTPNTSVPLFAPPFLLLAFRSMLLESWPFPLLKHTRCYQRKLIHYLTFARLQGLRFSNLTSSSLP